jgi:hypothetical protein
MASPKQLSSTSALREQLLQELQSLTGTDIDRPASSNPWRFRDILHQILGEAWSAVAHGDFTALRTLLHYLIEGEELIRADLPDPDPPQVEAAREVRYAAYVLHVAKSFVGRAQTGARLRDRQRSDFERKILRVLLEHQDRYLRRDEILKEMAKILPPPYPKGPRASQILGELYNERLLMRIQGSAQGNAQTSFFSLSPQGIELCGQLDLMEPVRLFETDAAKWGKYLQASWLAASSDEKQRDERIAVFYRPRPGVGCALALANCSVVLAREVKGLERNRVLVLDLEGEESSLPEHFSLKTWSCRGLAGLLEDYRRQPEETRKSWLENNLFTDAYVYRPRPELVGLFYLPPFERKPKVDLSHLYAAFLRDLRIESEQQPRQEDGAPGFASSGFLGDLREVLRTRCAKVLVQSPSGLGPGAYLASVLLAEELVLFLYPNDSQREGVQAVVREVVGNCLWRGSNENLDRPTVTYVLSTLPLKQNLNLAAGIDQLLLGPGTRRGGEVYRIVRLHFDQALAWGDPPPLGDLQSLTSLLAAGYRDLVDSLRPDASLVPASWQDKEGNMEYRIRTGLRSTSPFRDQEVSASGTPSPPQAATGAMSFAQRAAESPRPGPSFPRAPASAGGIPHRREEDLKPSLQALELVGAGQRD